MRRAMDEALGTPEQMVDGLERALNDPAIGDLTIGGIAVADAVVAECFRCGRRTMQSEKIVSPCQRDGCAGRYIKT